MRISSIQLKNFKSYRNQIFEFPPNNGNKNLIIIGGMNGYGKTTILEALYLGLYGKEGLIYLARAGFTLDRTEKNYSNYLTHAFNGNADPNSPMSIAIELLDENNQGFKIKRSWYFDQEKIWDGTDSDVTIYQIENGIQSIPIETDKWDEILNQYFIPANLAPFFFFDGEEVKSIASENKVQQVKFAIENFLGVVILRELQTRLKNFQYQRAKEISHVDVQQLEKLEERKNDLIDLIQRTSEEYENLMVDKNNIEKEWEDIQEKMLQLRTSDGSIATVSEISNNIYELKHSINTAKNELNKIVCHKLAINLIPAKYMYAFLEQIHKEITTRNWKRQCKSLEPKKEQFITKFKSIDNYEPKLTTSQKEQLTEAISIAWESLYFPPPANCTETCFHDYFTDEQITSIEDLYKKTHIAKKEIYDKLLFIKDANKRLQIWEKEMAKLEGYDKSGKLVNLLKTQFKEIDSSRDEIIRKITTTEHLINGYKKELNEVTATYEREHIRALENEPTNNLINKAKNICNFIDRLIDKLRVVKLEQLQKEMSDVFRKLSHKKHIEKIRLDDSGNAHFFNKEGQELDFEKSAGESQIFATTLLAALANVSSTTSPLVVDTPLGRLDSKHRDNILKYWIHNPNRQVILLSHDKEITTEKFEQLKGNILKSYLLEHIDMGEGVGFTSAREGYFGA